MGHQRLDQPAGGVLAFDVGGANLKAADGRGRVHAETFELWRRSNELADRLTAIAGAWRPGRIVATMTGEIADCYPDRPAGVASIVAALQTAASAVEADLGIYLVDGRLVAPEIAIADPLAAAASNWHVLARLAAAVAECDRGLLVDVGSTTTDILRFDQRRPLPLATDDAGRMASGELVYTGIERTPLAALVRSLPLAGCRRPLAAELYARAQDAWLLLGGLPENAASGDTADGRPATREGARGRLAHQMLLEPAAVSLDQATRAAERPAAVQVRLVARAIRRVIAHGERGPERVVLSGHGTMLAMRALEQAGVSAPVICLEERLGGAISRAAPAHALALVTLGELP